MDEEGRQRPIVMGSYGIGVGRLLACVAEHHRDERGLALPISVAPFQVALVSLAQDQTMRAQADDLYAQLQNAGIETLYDDREVSAGVKFADADLRGLPLRVTLSDRSIKRGGAELKLRSGSETRYVALDQVVSATREEIGKLEAALAEQLTTLEVWTGAEA
jgi:prolyl-tRNA synthetase